MACLPLCYANYTILSEKGANFFVGNSVSPLWRQQTRTFTGSGKGTVVLQCLHEKQEFAFPRRSYAMTKKSNIFIPKSSSSSNSGGAEGDSSDQAKKKPFGYNRKDVLLIGVGVTVIGVGLKSGLEFAGFDSLQAGNVVQLVIVLGLTVGWISTYIFRVSNKEMTYAQQLRDYEKKVMEKRLESLTEAELEALLESVEEEKRRLASREQAN